MRALFQRVSEASVQVDGQVIGQTGPGLLILICAMQGDDVSTAQKLAQKIVKTRIFKDEAGKMNRALPDSGASALVVSQFTLAADTSRGNRPGFSAAAAPDEGRALYHEFCAALQALNIHVETGAFGADMQVHLINDGPVTIWMDTQAG